SGAIIFVLVLGTSLVVAARELSTAAAHATTATVSNLGFLGPPLMLAFFGERGAGPLAMAILAEVMVLLSVGSVLMGANGGPKRGIGSLILRGTMFNPIVVAIVLGAALAGTGLALPEAITRFLGFLGGAAGPAAIFALGGALALQRLDRRTAVAACLITVAKLAVYPMLAWLILGRVGDPFYAFRNHGTRRGRLNSRVSCRGVVTPEIFLGFRSPVIFGQGSAPVAGCRDPSRFRPRQHFSPQALPSLLARLHLGH